MTPEMAEAFGTSEEGFDKLMVVSDCLSLIPRLHALELIAVLLVCWCMISNLWVQTSPQISLIMFVIGVMNRLTF
jgi:hypothetical protein